MSPSLVLYLRLLLQQICLGFLSKSVMIFFIKSFSSWTQLLFWTFWLKKLTVFSSSLKAVNFSAAVFDIFDGGDFSSELMRERRETGTGFFFTISRWLRSIVEWRDRRTGYNLRLLLSWRTLLSSYWVRCITFGEKGDAGHAFSNDLLRNNKFSSI